MGLGLAASSLICKAMGGELNLIRSEENEGSKFEFTIKVEMGREMEGEFKTTDKILSNEIIQKLPIG